jgi:hypothetical protein
MCITYKNLIFSTLFLGKRNHSNEFLTSCARLAPRDARRSSCNVYLNRNSHVSANFSKPPNIIFYGNPLSGQADGRMDRQRDSREKLLGVTLQLFIATVPGTLTNYLPSLLLTTRHTTLYSYNVVHQSIANYVLGFYTLWMWAMLSPSSISKSVSCWFFSVFI